MGVDTGAVVWYGIRRNPPEPFLELLREAEEESQYGEWSVDGIHITTIYNYDTPIGWGAYVMYRHESVETFDPDQFSERLQETKDVVDRVLKPFVLEEEPTFYFHAVWT